MQSISAIYWRWFDISTQLYCGASRVLPDPIPPPPLDGLSDWLTTGGISLRATSGCGCRLVSARTPVLALRVGPPASKITQQRASSVLQLLHRTTGQLRRLQSSSSSSSSSSWKLWGWTPPISRRQTVWTLRVLIRGKCRRACVVGSCVVLVSPWDGFQSV